MTVENTIPLLLQSQFNHILHLDSQLSALRELVTVQRVKDFGKRSGVSKEKWKKGKNIKEFHFKFLNLSGYEKLIMRSLRITFKFLYIKINFPFFHYFPFSLHYTLNGLRELSDARFGKVDERFEKIHKRIGWLFGIVIAIMGIGFTYISILISVVK